MIYATQRCNPGEREVHVTPATLVHEKCNPEGKSIVEDFVVQVGVDKVV